MAQKRDEQGACLHLIDTGGPGGAETMFQHLAVRLHGRPLRSIAVVPREGWLSRVLRSRGIEARITDVKGSFNLHLLRTLTRIARENDVRLIHAHLLGSSVYGALAGLMLKLPVIAVFHGPHDLQDPGRFVGAKRWLLKHACSKLIAVSGSTRERLVQFGVDPKKVSVVRNGIHIDPVISARCLSLRQEIGVGYSDCLIGAVGNVRTPKAYDVLLRAAALVLSRCPHVHFAIIGEGSESAMRPLLELRDSLNIRSRFHFLGFRKTDAQLLTNFDVFVSSSRSEGLPLSFLEAWASGLPIVATRSGGAQEVIAQDQTGLLVPIDDPAALATALERTVFDSSLRRRLGDAGRNLVDREYNLNYCIDRYAAIHQELLSRSSR